MPRPHCSRRLLLRSTTSDENAEGRQELETARALMRETGAVLFENFINATNVEQSNARQISIGPAEQTVRRKNGPSLDPRTGSAFSVFFGSLITPTVPNPSIGRADSYSIPSRP